MLKNDLQSAKIIVQRLNQQLHNYGWITALYGSSITGKIREPGDIDLIIFNKWENPPIRHIEVILQEMGNRIAG